MEAQLQITHQKTIIILYKYIPYNFNYLSGFDVHSLKIQIY
jgi:hypothetical protein